jgi:catechol 2,3-dioxygenase-like lactoylglutathione lyase family enzyme
VKPIRTALIIAAAIMVACTPPSPEPGPEAAPERRPMTANIIGNNVFFYYENFEEAVAFYEELLGLEVVADYGFAKILRVAETSFLTLVSGGTEMHSTDEPKAVAIALLTEELEEWYAYLVEHDVPMRGELKVNPGGPHDGFVAYDPEGYYLEFERFNPHPENEKLIPALAEVDSLYTDKGSPELGFQATVLWLYYDDLTASQSFYENVMGFELIVDQGWAKVFPTSKSGFIGLVDGARGMHKATRDKAVTVSFLTDDVDAWFTHMKSQEVLEAFDLRHQEVLDEGFVRVFVGYDPENYFLEFDQFVEHEDNVDFLRILAE